MLCVVVLKVEDGDFSDLKGSALSHYCITVGRRYYESPINDDVGCYTINRYILIPALFPYSSLRSINSAY